MYEGLELNRLADDRPRLRLRHPKAIAVAELVVLAALLALFIGRGLLPGWRTLNSDFPNYYLAASLHHRSIPIDRVYEWIWFQRQKHYLNIEQAVMVFTPNPPLCALPILPLSHLPPLAAKRVWLVLNLGFLVSALWFLHRVTKLALRHAAIILLLCIVPLRINFLLGQYYVVILWLICAAYYCSCLKHRFTSGLLLSAAACFKLFPAVFLILFIWKRDWRSAAGMILGTAVLTAISIAVFGVEVHRILLIEVLPRAVHGELIEPYSLLWNSFPALWHHLFLFEPGLNPSPLLNSPVLYALTQATTSVCLLFGFLWTTREDRLKPTKPLEWAAIVALSLLLSSIPEVYHYCVLVFTATVGIDELLKIRDGRKALIFILLFLFAYGPLPARIAKMVLPRLVGTLALYSLLLSTIASGKSKSISKRWLAAGVLTSAVLTISSLIHLKNRSEDFDRRLTNLSSIGYSASNPLAVRDGVVFTDMLDDGYAAMALHNNTVRRLPIPGDVLSVGGNFSANAVYLEQAAKQSLIAEMRLGSSNLTTEYIGVGTQPRVSQGGRWLAFVREENGKTVVLLCEAATPRNIQVIRDPPNILDVSVTQEGDLIAAAGAVSHPQLFRVSHSTGLVEPLAKITGPVRYPAISPDGRRLAFSRRMQGSWHLVVREMPTGIEQQLTHAECNATLPSWESPQALLYATDCGRGLGLSTLARFVLPD